MPSAAKYTSWSTKSLNPFANAYGIMRSPWNNNQSPKIGRLNNTYGSSQYTSMPSCSIFMDCFSRSKLSSMSECFNGATHGPAHILIGGSWGVGDLFANEDDHLGFLQNPDKLLLFKRASFSACLLQLSLTDKHVLFLIMDELPHCTATLATLRAIALLTTSHQFWLKCRMFLKVLHFLSILDHLRGQ